MKRIPFTLEAWKAGGVPVTRSGEYVKQLTYFEGVGIEYYFAGVLERNIKTWDISGRYITDSDDPLQFDLLLEVPCTKYYTHYYREIIGAGIMSYTDQKEVAINLNTYTHIKTVEVEF